MTTAVLARAGQVVGAGKFNQTEENRTARAPWSRIRRGTCRCSFEERSRCSARISSGRGGCGKRNKSPIRHLQAGQRQNLQGLHRDSSKAGSRSNKTQMYLHHCVPPKVVPPISKQQLPCGRQRWRAGIRRGTGRLCFVVGDTMAVAGEKKYRDCLTMLPRVKPSGSVAGVVFSSTSIFKLCATTGEEEKRQ